MYKLFNDFDRKVSKGRKYLGEDYIKIFSKIIKIFSKLRTQKIRKTHIKSS